MVHNARMDERQNHDVRDLESCKEWFRPHAPRGNQADRYVSIRDGARSFAELVIAKCPPSADRTVALRKIREAVFVANASIAIGEVSTDGVR